MEKGYKRFAPEQSVGLRYANLVLTCTDVIRENGIITELRVNCANVADAKKPKGFIHWVANPVSLQVRQYERL